MVTRTRSQVLSLFGATPEQVRQAELQRQQDFLAEQQSGFGKAGAGLGLALASLFGGKSPEMKQAEARQEVRTDLGDTLALAEQEATQRGMAPLTQDEVSLLNRRANELQTIAAGFRNLGEDTTEIENAAIEARLNALQTKRELENEALRRRASELSIQQSEIDIQTAENQEQVVAKQREAAAKFLEGRGNIDLANAVRSGAVPIKTAVDSALKGTDSAVVGESLVNKQTGEVIYSAPAKPGEKYTLLTDDEKRKNGLNPNTPYQQNTQTGQIKAVTGGSSLLMSTPPQGYRLVETIDNQGRPSVFMETIPGSPQAKAEEAQTEAAKAGLRNTGEKVSAVTSTIDEALTILEDPDVAGRTGAAIDLAGRLTGGIATAGTQRINLTEKLTTIKANIGFDRLQKMREESPTGGALGQVAIQELVALQASIASLNPNLKAEDLRFNLARVKEQYNSTAEALANAYTDEQLIKQGVPELIKYRTRTTTPSGDIVELPTERTANGFDISKLPDEVKDLWSMMTDEEKKLFGWTP